MESRLPRREGQTRREARAEARAAAATHQVQAPPPRDLQSDEVLGRLFRSRIILLNGAIDEDLANRATAQLLLLAETDPAADISLYINSPGGSVTAAMAIYDTMQLISPDVATVTPGLAAGTAQLLLTAGARGKRTALPTARILLSQPTGEPSTPEALHVLARTRDEIAEITAQETGRPVAQIRADAQSGRWFDAYEAVGYGLIDQVVAKLQAH